MAKKSVKVNKPHTTLPSTLYEVDKGALSVTVGPACVAELAKTMKEEAKVVDALDAIDRRMNYDIPAMLTEAIVKAAKADKSIDLADVYGTKDRVTVLNGKLGIALGLREIVTDDKDKQKLIWAKSLNKYFPAPGDKPEDETTVQKNTFRTNFLHKLKLCVQAAHTIVSKNIEIKRTDNTLRLTGPAVEKEFGATSVLLNEKRTQDEVELKAKPSFTSAAKLGAPKEAKVGRVTAKSEPTHTSPQEAVRSIADSLLRALDKIGKSPLEPETRHALNNVTDKIDELLSD